MTKNNRFKKIVRAYQNAFNVPYMTALNAVSQPFLVTPEMEKLAHTLQNIDGGGIVLIGGSSGRGKTFLQHYLTQNLGSKRVIEQDYCEEISSYVQPALLSNGGNFSNYSTVLMNDSLLFKPGGVSDFGTYFRLRAEVVSMPEIRGYESDSYLKMLRYIAEMEILLLTNIHATDSPSSIMDRLANFLTYRKVVTNNSLSVGQFMRNNIKMIVQTDRAFIKQKSIVTVSHFEITDEIVEAWNNRELDSFLMSQKYVTAGTKMKTILNGL